MARRVKDRNLDTRDARRKLSASGKPYWRAVGKGLHVGYRKGKTSGVWVIRRYLGDRSYKIETIAEADDILDADGEGILDFWQAQDRARGLRRDDRGRVVRLTYRDRRSPKWDARSHCRHCIPPFARRFGSKDPQR